MIFNTIAHRRGSSQYRSLQGKIRQRSSSQISQYFETKMSQYYDGFLRSDIQTCETQKTNKYNTLRLINIKQRCIFGDQTNKTAISLNYQDSCQIKNNDYPSKKRFRLKINNMHCLRYRSLQTKQAKRKYVRQLGVYPKKLNGRPIQQDKRTSEANKFLANKLLAKPEVYKQAVTRSRIIKTNRNVRNQKEQFCGDFDITPW